MRVEVNGQTVDIDDSFGDASPEDQEKTINEIAASLGSTPSESDIPSLPDARVPDSAYKKGSLTDQALEAARPVFDPVVVAGKGLLSAGEGALSMASGFVPGLHNALSLSKHGLAQGADALANVATGRELMDPHISDPEFKKYENQSWYAPKTEAGALIPETMDRGINAIKDKVKSLLEEHGHPALAASVDPAFEAGGQIAQVAGAGSLLKGGLSDTAKSSLNRDVAKQAALDVIKSKDEHIIKAFDDGRKHGLVVAPAEMPHSQKGRELQADAGKILSEADASVINAEKMHEVFSKENGFKENQPIKNEDINERIKQEKEKFESRKKKRKKR